MNPLKRILIIPAAIAALTILGAGIAFALEEDEDAATSTNAFTQEQADMREDLAGRLGVDRSEVSLVSFREVTWPDGCLGVINPAALCMQGLTEGYLAVLQGPDGKEYRYHGTDGHFIAVDFEEGIVGIQEPVSG